MISHDFTAGIEAPKSDSKLPVYMNLEEVRQLFAYVERDIHPLALRNQVMIKLLATTGMRRQEIVDLNSSISIMKPSGIYGKGKKERLLPLHSMMVPLLKEYKASLEPYQVHSEEAIFITKNRKKLNPRGLHVIFKRVLKEASLPPHLFSLHHLRHTFATLLLQQGNIQTKDEHGNPSSISKEKVDLRTLQELLGHESLATTQVYTHMILNPKRKRLILSVLNARRSQYIFFIQVNTPVMIHVRSQVKDQVYSCFGNF
ncbi:MAG: tyrosine-type recombinase/integrase [Bacillota bacterium]